jgi:anti-anti-sigma factor
VIPRRLVWPLTISPEIDRGALILTVCGRIGTASCGELIEALMQAIRDGHRRIVLDLAGVDYLSGAGLLALDAMAARLHEAKGTLVLCTLAEPVRLALDLAGVPLDVELTRADGLARVLAAS